VPKVARLTPERGNMKVTIVCPMCCIPLRCRMEKTGRCWYIPTHNKCKGSGKYIHDGKTYKKVNTNERDLLVDDVSMMRD
jgi:hypothetical protein